ncbi:hypothetical protein, partial [Geobacter anodireducens]
RPASPQECNYRMRDAPPARPTESNAANATARPYAGPPPTNNLVRNHVSKAAQQHNAPPVFSSLDFSINHVLLINRTFIRSRFSTRLPPIILNLQGLFLDKLFKTKLY